LKEVYSALREARSQNSPVKLKRGGRSRGDGFRGSRSRPRPGVVLILQQAFFFKFHYHILTIFTQVLHCHNDHYVFLFVGKVKVLYGNISVFGIFVL
jgi:hypothetical protein